MSARPAVYLAPAAHLVGLRELMRAHAQREQAEAERRRAQRNDRARQRRGARKVAP